MGDFLGFTFGNVHSSDLGITRVSGGDRYEEQLHPEIKDRTAEVPGLNGEYYFGSNFGTKSFDIEIAFDHLTEEQFKKLRKVFGTKKVQKLIFDERPYKYYMAKLESPVELSYVCFDEPKKVVVGIDSGDERYGVRVVNRTITSNTEQVEDEETGEITDITTYTTTIERERIYPYEIQEGKERIYKGEGKMTFICYFPFAKSNFKVLPQAGDEYYEGSDEWAISSGILSQTERDINSIDIYNEGTINIYNPGDIATGFRMYIPKNLLESQDIQLIYNDPLNDKLEVLSLGQMEIQDGDAGVLIDTNLELIVGVTENTYTTQQYDENTGETVEVEISEAIYTDLDGNVYYTTSGNLYNQFIQAGYLFKIEPTISNSNATIQIIGGGDGIQIFYDYLYF